MKLLLLKITLSIILSLACFSAFCQKGINPFAKNVAYAGMYGLVDTSRATPRQLAAVHKQQKAKILAHDHYYYNIGDLRNIGVRFTAGVASDIYEGKPWGDDYKSILIDGDCDIELSALDIDETNAGNYRYHVVQNNTKELVSWTKPSVFKLTTDKKAKYAYLGRFKYTPGQVLKVEIYNINNYKQLDAMLIDWRKVVPAKVYSLIQYFNPHYPLPDNGLTSRALDASPITKETVFKKVNGKYTIKNHVVVGTERLVQVKDFIESPNKQDIRFRADDSVQNLHFTITNRDVIYNYKVSLKRELNGNIDSLRLGETNTDMDINKELWKTPGKYTVIFTPKIHKHGGQPIYLLRNLATSISFTVLPPLNTRNDVPLKTVIAIVLVLMIATLTSLALFRRGQKRRLAQEAQKKQIATLQLQSVRAQLNPHFIFNALAGIQNLMNKNEVENANKYLSRFARLTRNVLDDSHKELATIEHETDLLNDYLQMEQMRFGFKFTITVNEQDIDQQIEIPTMLLQPFVENAIKHGVSALKGEGLVTVNIAKNNNDILLLVQDNGKGFQNNQQGGMGLKLCRDRIALLNSIYKNTAILLHIKTDDKGTLITMQLKNWL